MQLPQNLERPKQDPSALGSFFIRGCVAEQPRLAVWCSRKIGHGESWQEHVPRLLACLFTCLLLFFVCLFCLCVCLFVCYDVVLFVFVLFCLFLFFG